MYHDPMHLTNYIS